MQYLTPKYTAMCIAILLFASNNTFAHEEVSTRTNTRTFGILMNPNNAILHYNYEFSNSTLVNISAKEKISIENFKKKSNKKAF